MRLKDARYMDICNSIDYDHSLLSVISSVSSHFKLPAANKTLSELDRLLETRYKNVILLIFDGMGMSVLERHLPPDSFLRKSLLCSISSVFPPTTTAATTSILTGQSPAEHGRLGWSLWFEQLGKVVELYPNTSGGLPAADFNAAERFLPFETIIDRINGGGEFEAHYVSPFTMPRATTFDELFCRVKELCGKDKGKYIYGYSPLPDHDMHDFGVEGDIIGAELK